ncbi:MAG: DUF134 domain-containing protein [Clostridia bacterium]|nr:DUF134 domain-containing protein [Clostridia bacterium]
MPRPPKHRRVEFMPAITFFKPAGVPLRQLEEVVLAVEEVEAIRLKDMEGLEQEDCAARMGISRPTFFRVLNAARQKLAEALINGKAIRVEGGYYRLVVPKIRCRSCEYQWDSQTQEAGACPQCGSEELEGASPRPGRRRRQGWRGGK